MSSITLPFSNRQTKEAGLPSLPATSALQQAPLLPYLAEEVVAGRSCSGE